ncbi:hypothetical protein [Dactylosporangium sp. CA-092794]|uniref:WXG100-like domain-containing protein n=1 Tax=Dactylosporangium sp. CA-092794 TaxID=3239929 RepID=UPI003D8F44C8
MGDIEASRVVAGILKWITGEEFPATRETHLFSYGSTLQSAAGSVEAAHPHLVDGVRQISSGVSGQAQHAFVASMQPYVNHNPGYLRSAATSMRRAGRDIRDLGTQVQYVKMMIIATIVELMAEFAAAMAFSFFNPGLAMHWLAARVAMVRLLVRTWLGRLILQIALNQIIGVGLQTLMDAIIQRLQIDGGTRDHWDGRLSRQAASAGALGGAVGTGLGMALGRVIGRHGAEAGARELADAMPAAPVGAAGWRHATEEVAQEVGTEYLTEGLYGAMTGQGWSVGLAAASSGLVSGGFSAAGSRLGDGLRGTTRGNASGAEQSSGAGSSGPAEEPRRVARPYTFAASGSSSPIGVGDGVRPPWYFRQFRSLGDGGISAPPATATGHGRAAEELNRFAGQVSGSLAGKHQERARQWVVAQLSQSDPREWERLLLRGAQLSFGNHRVDLQLAVGELTHHPSSYHEPDYEEYKSKYGDSTVARSMGRSRRLGLQGVLDPLLFVGHMPLSHVGPALRVGVLGEQVEHHGTVNEVQSGNRLLANPVHEFRSALEATATVTGPGGAGGPFTLSLPQGDGPTFSFPQAFTTTGPEPQRQHPNLDVSNPNALHSVDYAINAVRVKPIVSEVRAALGSAGLPQPSIDKLIREMSDEILNEKTLRDRSQYLLGGGLASQYFHDGRSGFAGHIDINARLDRLQYLETTAAPMKIRNDIADTFTMKDGFQHTGGASAAVVVDLGFPRGDHLVSPSIDVVSVQAATSHTRTTQLQGQAKTALMREDHMVRYAGTFEVTLDLRSTTHGDRRIRAEVQAELAMGEQHAALFEEAALALPRRAGGKQRATPASGRVPVRATTAPGIPLPVPDTATSMVVQPFAAPLRLDPRKPIHTPSDLLRLSRAYRPEPSAGRRTPPGSLQGRLVRPFRVLAHRVAPLRVTLPQARPGHRPEIRLHLLDGARQTSAVRRLLAKDHVTRVSAEGAASFRIVRDERRAGRTPLAVARQVASVLRHGRRGDVRVTRTGVQIDQPGTLRWLPFSRSGATGPWDLLSYAERGPIEVEAPPEFNWSADQGRQRLFNHPNVVVVAPGAGRTESGALFRYVIEANGAVAGARSVAIADSSDRAPVRWIPNPAWTDVPTEPVTDTGGEDDPAPEPTSGPVVWPEDREPIVLAARKGLGAGVVREISGAELLLPAIVENLHHQLRVAGVGASLTARDLAHLHRALAVRFSVPGLRAGFRGLAAGGSIDHVFSFSGRTFTVAVVADLLDRVAPPVDEEGVSVDVQAKGSAGVDVGERRSRRFGGGGDLSTRLDASTGFAVEVNAPRIEGGWSVDNRHTASSGVKEYKRRRTAGTVRRFEYHTAYTASVISQHTDGRVRTAWRQRFDGPQVRTAVMVSAAFLPERGFTEEQVRAFGAVETRDGDLSEAAIHEWVGGDRDQPVLFDAGDLNGVFVTVHGTKALTDEMARLVTEHSGEDVAAGRRDLFVTALRSLVSLSPVAPQSGESMRRLGRAIRHEDRAGHNARLRATLSGLAASPTSHGVPEQILRSGTPTFLDANIRRLASADGLRIPLPPTRDGHLHALVVTLRPVNVVATGDSTDVSLEQYTEADTRFVTEREAGWEFAAEAGLGAVGRLEGRQAEEAQQDHGTSSRKLGSQIGAGVGAGMHRAWKRQTSELTGGIDLNLATYRGPEHPAHTYTADGLFTIKYVRWKQGVVRGTHSVSTSVRHVRIGSAVEATLPHQRAVDRGLVAAEPAAGAEPATLHVIDPELALGIGQLEQISAAGVLPEIVEELRRRQVLPDLPYDEQVPSDVMWALQVMFSEEAIRAHYGAVRSTGLHLVVKTPGWGGGTLRTGIRVVARESGDLTYRRARPDVTITSGGQLFDQRTDAEMRHQGTRWDVHLGGRWADVSGARLPLSAHIGGERGSVTKTGEKATSRMIARATPKDQSQEFAVDVQYTWEIFQTRDLAEILRQAGRPLGLLPRAARILTRGRSRRLWRKYFPPGTARIGHGTVDGWARLTVPSHLTQLDRPSATMSRSVTPAFAPTVRHRHGSAPEPGTAAVFAAEIGAYLQALAMPESKRVAAWVPAVMRSASRFDQFDVTRPYGADPGIANDSEKLIFSTGYSPTGTDRVGIESLLNERTLRANLQRLVNGSYPLAKLGGEPVMVRLTPTNGRFVKRAEFGSVLNFPETSVEPEIEHETYRGHGIALDAAFGAHAGQPLPHASEPTLLTGGALPTFSRLDRIRDVISSAGDYVESNRQRSGEFDYYTFDVEYTVTGPELTMTATVAEGLKGVLPAYHSQRLAEEFPDLIASPPGVLAGQKVPAGTGRAFISDEKLPINLINPAAPYFAHVSGSGDEAVWNPSSDVHEVPWQLSGASVYVAAVHGEPGRVLLPGAAGQTDAPGTTEPAGQSATRLGRALRRRPSLLRLDQDAPIVMVACDAATPGDDGVTVAQRVADETRRDVWAPTGQVVLIGDEDVSFGLRPRADGARAEWIRFSPSSGPHRAMQSTGPAAAASASAAATGGGLRQKERVYSFTSRGGLVGPSSPTAGTGYLGPTATHPLAPATPAPQLGEWAAAAAPGWPREYLNASLSLGDAIEVVPGSADQVAEAVRAVVDRAAGGGSISGLDELLQSRVFDDVDALLGRGGHYEIRIGGTVHELRVRVTLGPVHAVSTTPGNHNDVSVSTSARSAATKTVTSALDLSLTAGLGGLVGPPTGITGTVRGVVSARDLTHSATAATVTREERRGRAPAVATTTVGSTATYDISLWRRQGAEEQGVQDNAGQLLQRPIQLDVPSFPPVAGRTATTEFPAGADTLRRQSHLHIPEAVATQELWTLLQAQLPVGLFEIGTTSRRRLLAVADARAIKASLDRYAGGLPIPALLDERTGELAGPYVITAVAERYTEHLPAADVEFRIVDHGGHDVSHTTGAGLSLGVSARFGVSAGASGAGGGAQGVFTVEGGSRRVQTAMFGGAGARTRTVVYKGPSVLREYQIRWTLRREGGDAESRSEGTDRAYVRLPAADMTTLAAPEQLSDGMSLLRGPLGDGAVVSVTGLEQVRDAVKEILRAHPGLLPDATHSSPTRAGLTRAARMRLAEAQQRADIVEAALSEPNVRGMVDSLLDTGLSFTLTQYEKFRVRHFRVSVTARRTGGRLTGQSSTVMFRSNSSGDRRAAAELAAVRQFRVGALVGYIRTLQAPDRTTLGTIGIDSSYGYTADRRSNLQLQSSEASLLVSTPGAASGSDGRPVTAHAYDLDVEFDVEVTGHTRPRAWARGLALGLFDTSADRRWPIGRDAGRGQIEPFTRTGAGNGTLTVWMSTEWSRVARGELVASPGPGTSVEAAGSAVRAAAPVPASQAPEPTRALLAQLPLRLHATAVRDIAALRSEALRLFNETPTGRTMVLPGSQLDAELDAFLRPEYLVGQLTSLIQPGQMTGAITWRGVFLNYEADLWLSFTPTRLYDPVLISSGLEHALVARYTQTFQSGATHRLGARLAGVSQQQLSRYYGVAGGGVGFTTGWGSHRDIARTASVERNVTQSGPFVVYRVDGEWTLTASTRRVGAMDVFAGAVETRGSTIPISDAVRLAIPLAEVHAANARVEAANQRPDGAPGDRLDPLELPAGADPDGSKAISVSAPEQPWRSPELPGLGAGFVDHIADPWPILALLHDRLDEAGITIDLDGQTSFTDTMGNTAQLMAVFSRRGLAGFIDSALAGGILLRLHRRGPRPYTLGVIRTTDGVSVRIQAILRDVRAVDVVDDGTANEFGIRDVIRTSVDRTRQRAFEAEATYVPAADRDGVVAVGLGPGVAIAGRADTVDATFETRTRDRVVISEGPTVRYTAQLQVTATVVSSRVRDRIEPVTQALDIAFRMPELNVRVTPPPERPEPEHPVRREIVPERAAAIEWQASGTSLPDAAVITSFTGSSAAEAAALAALRAQGTAGSAIQRLRHGTPMASARDLTEAFVHAMVSPEASMAFYHDIADGGHVAQIVGPAMTAVTVMSLARYARLDPPRLVRVGATTKFDHPRQDARGSTTTTARQGETTGRLDLRAQASADVQETGLGGVPARVGATGRDTRTIEGAAARTSNPRQGQTSFLFSFDSTELFVASPHHRTGEPTAYEVSLRDALIVEVPESVARAAGWLGSDNPERAQAIRSVEAAWQDALAKRVPWLEAGDAERAAAQETYLAARREAERATDALAALDSGIAGPAGAPEAVPSAAPGPSAMVSWSTPSAWRPVARTEQGVRRLADELHRQVPRGEGEEYCVALMVAARERLISRPSFGGVPGSLFALDDSATGLGLWSGWGKASSWPRVPGSSVLHDLVAQVPGRMAFVLMDRAGVVGHAFVAVHTEQGVLVLDPAATDPMMRVHAFGSEAVRRVRGLDSGVAWRARVYNADGSVVPVPAGSVESADAVLPLLSASEGRYAGSGIEDEETVPVYLPDPEDPDVLLGDPFEHDGDILADAEDESFRIEVETKEFYRGNVDGLLYRTRDAAAAAGNEDPEEETLAMIERVGGIFSYHPHEVGRHDPERAFGAFREMADRASRLTAPSGTGPAVSLPALYDGLPLNFTELGEGAHVGPRPIGDWPGSHFHFTQGVVLEGMRDFLEFARDNVWRDESHNYRTKTHLSDALAFGDDVAARFLEYAETGRLPQAMDARRQRAAVMVSGHAALLYGNVAGAAQHRVDGGLAKAHVAVLSRVDFALLLRALPEEARVYLALDAGHLLDRFEQRFLGRQPSFLAGLAEPGRGPAPAGLLDLGVGVHHRSLRDYLTSGLADDFPNPLGQDDAFGGMTVLPGLDLNAGGLLLPHVVVEVRSHGRRHMPVADAERYHREIAGRAAELYDAALRVDPDVTYADAAAWSENDRTGLASAGLHWLGDGADPPQWAASLGETAMSRDRPVVVVEISDGNAAPALSSLLARDPALARRAVFVLQSGYVDLYQIARTQRLVTMYPIRTEREERLRLISMGNDVHDFPDLPDVAVTPDVLRRAFDRVDDQAGRVLAARAADVPAMSGARRPVAMTANGMRSLADRVRSRVQRDDGDEYCVALMVAAREELFAEPSFGGAHGGRFALDDSVVGLGLWSGWGRALSWPRVSGWTEVRASVTQVPGRVAFVLMERAGTVGHALVVAHTEQGVLVVDPAATDPMLRVHAFGSEAAGEIARGLRSGTALRVRLYEADGRAVPLPGLLESADPVLPLLLPPDTRFAGSGVEDEETVLVYLPDPDDPQGILDDPDEVRTAILAESPDRAFHIEVETKRFYRGGDDDLVYRTREAALASGNRSVTGERLGMIERVGGIFSYHPHEVGRHDPAPVFDAFQAMATSAEALKPAGSGPVVAMPVLYRDLGLEFTELGRTARVGPRPLGDWPGSHYHFTQGVVLEGMREFLEFARDNVWRDESYGYLTKTHLSDALEFGDDVAARFLEYAETGRLPRRARGAAGQPREVSAGRRRAAAMVSGHAALLYSNAAGAVQHLVDRRLNKAEVAVLSRVDFPDQLRGLPDLAREYLARDAENLFDRFEAKFLTRVADLPTKIELPRGYAPRTLLDVSLRRGRARLRDYLMGGLVQGYPAPSSQNDVFGGVNTLDGLDLNDGGLLLPHAVVEVRSHGRRHMPVAEARRYHAEVAATAARLYDAALDVDPDVQYSDAVAWSADDRTGPSPVGLYWVSDVGEPSEWANELGDAAESRVRAVVVVDHADEDIAAAQLASLLADEPALARRAVFVFQSGYVGPHRISREHRLATLYAIRTETEDRLRLISIGNDVHDFPDVHDLPDVAVTPEVLHRALDRIDDLAKRAIRERAANVEVPHLEAPVEVLRKWPGISAIRGIRRSAELGRIDQAVESWRASTLARPDDTAGHASRLDDVLSAIAAWREQKPGGSVRLEVVGLLEDQVRRELAQLRRADAVVAAGVLDDAVSAADIAAAIDGLELPWSNGDVRAAYGVLRLHLPLGRTVRLVRLGVRAAGEPGAARTLRDRLPDLSAGMNGRYRLADGDQLHVLVEYDDFAPSGMAVAVPRESAGAELTMALRTRLWHLLGVDDPPHERTLDSHHLLQLDHAHRGQGPLPIVERTVVKEPEAPVLDIRRPVDPDSGVVQAFADEVARYAYASAVSTDARVRLAVQGPPAEPVVARLGELLRQRLGGMTGLMEGPNRWEHVPSASSDSLVIAALPRVASQPASPGLGSFFVDLGRDGALAGASAARLSARLAEAVAALTPARGGPIAPVQVQIVVFQVGGDAVDQAAAGRFVGALRDRVITEWASAAATMGPGMIGRMSIGRQHIRMSLLNSPVLAGSASPAWASQVDVRVRDIARGAVVPAGSATPSRGPEADAEAIVATGLSRLWNDRPAAATLAQYDAADAADVVERVERRLAEWTRRFAARGLAGPFAPLTARVGQPAGGDDAQSPGWSFPEGGVVRAAHPLSRRPFHARLPLVGGELGTAAIAGLARYAEWATAPERMHLVDRNGGDRRPPRFHVVTYAIGGGPARQWRDDGLRLANTSAQVLGQLLDRSWPTGSGRPVVHVETLGLAARLPAGPARRTQWGVAVWHGGPAADGVAASGPPDPVYRADRVGEVLWLRRGTDDTTDEEMIDVLRSVQPGSADVVLGRPGRELDFADLQSLRLRIGEYAAEYPPSTMTVVLLSPLVVDIGPAVTDLFGALDGRVVVPTSMPILVAGRLVADDWMLYQHGTGGSFGSVFPSRAIPVVAGLLGSASAYRIHDAGRVVLVGPDGGDGPRRPTLPPGTRRDFLNLGVGDDESALVVAGQPDPELERLVLRMLTQMMPQPGETLRVRVICEQLPGAEWVEYVRAAGYVVQSLSRDAAH